MSKQNKNEENKNYALLNSMREATLKSTGARIMNNVLNDDFNYNICYQCGLQNHTTDECTIKSVSVIILYFNRITRQYYILIQRRGQKCKNKCNPLTCKKKCNLKSCIGGYIERVNGESCFQAIGREMFEESGLNLHLFIHEHLINKMKILNTNDLYHLTYILMVDWYNITEHEYRPIKKCESEVNMKYGINGYTWENVHKLKENDGTYSEDSYENILKILPYFKNKNNVLINIQDMKKDKIINDINYHYPSFNYLDNCKKCLRDEYYSYNSYHKSKECKIKLISIVVYINNGGYLLIEEKNIKNNNMTLKLIDGYLSKYETVLGALIRVLIKNTGLNLVKEYKEYLKELKYFQIVEGKINFYLVLEEQDFDIENLKVNKYYQISENRNTTVCGFKLLSYGELVDNQNNVVENITEDSFNEIEFVCKHKMY
jgi:hypothetical protein